MRIIASKDDVCDAAEALWVPETTLPSLEDQFFEDHSNMTFTLLDVEPTMTM